MDFAPLISPLPADAIAQIKSSIAVTSLNAVATGLLKNSLDADSKRIEVTLDYYRGNCIVEDDGLGIPPLEFKESGGLGKLHHSSKHKGITVKYGSRGEFLASVAALSLMSITSRHHLHHSHNALIINRSQVVARETPAPPRQHIHGHKHGTRIAVRDLFGNMPVRVKQRVRESSRLSGSVREWEELRKLVTSLVLAWPSSVLIVVRDGVSGQKLQLRGGKSPCPSGNAKSETIFVANVCNTLSQAMYISSPDQSKWVSTKAATPRIRIQGAISLEPSPTKAAQFLSLGIEPLTVQNGHNVLYDEINRVFENSSFGNECESSDFDATQAKEKHENQPSKIENLAVKELKGSRKAFDRWPTFFIKIEFLDPITHEVQNGVGEDVVEDRKGSLTDLVELLKAMVLEFLKSQNFRPRFMGPVHLSRNRELESARNLLGDSLIARGGKELGLHSLNQPKAPRTGSPFNTWSRVKSGRPKLPSNISEQLYKPMGDSSNGEIEIPVLLASKSKMSPCSPSISGLSSPGLETDAPTVSQCGKVIRPPFGRLPAVIAKTVSTSPLVENDLSNSDSNSGNSEEEHLNWISPITKIESLVNSRTGLVTKFSKVNRMTSYVSSHLKPESQGTFFITDHVAVTENTESKAGSSIWIDGILRNWNNPVYRPTEAPIPQVSTKGPRNESQQLLKGNRHKGTQLDDALAFQETSVGQSGRISKEALRQAEVIAQVDSKFILIKVPPRALSSDDEHASFLTEMLVIVDQHAADERCRVEELLADLFSAPVPIMAELTTQTASSQSGVLTTVLEKPLSFVMPGREIQLLQMHAQHFASWGIVYEVQHAELTTDKHPENKVVVRSLPPSIIERCTTVPKLLVQLLRSEVWKHSEKGSVFVNIGNENDITGASLKHPWLRKTHGCPQAFVEMLNSRACRSAIMFNDELSNNQCKALMSRLAECAFPFQCAHGRPSMIPLLNLDSFTLEIGSNERAGLQHEEHFGAALKRWKQEMADIKLP